MRYNEGMKKNSKMRGVIGFAAVFIVVVAILYVTGIGCPIRFFTGISCPGCGLTRAYWEAFHLNFKAAFYYHPGFLLVIPAVILSIFSDRIKKPVGTTLYILLIAAFLIIYIVRLWNGSEIVAWNLENGFFYRVWKNCNF